MGKYCIEEITMGFAFPEPKSIFYGYFTSEEDAINWGRNKHKGWEEINEGQIFFQKDFGASIKEAFVQNCEDKDFIRYSKFSSSNIKLV